MIRRMKNDGVRNQNVKISSRRKVAYLITSAVSFIKTGTGGAEGLIRE